MTVTHVTARDRELIRRALAILIASQSITDDDRAAARRLYTLLESADVDVTPPR